jgi:allantoinase
VIVRGGSVVSSRGVERVDIAVGDDGVIEVLGHDLDEQPQEIDATGLHVFPGGVDSHVHLNEPGHSDWETVAAGSSALAAGGYTAFVDMPLNNLPVTTTASAFEAKLAAMRESSRVDYGLWGGLVPGNAGELHLMLELGAMGFKAFMCPSGLDAFPACDVATLREGMRRIAELDSILLVHAEDPALLTIPAGPTAMDFIRSRPPEAEMSAIRTVVELATETGCRVHVVHVSTAEGAALLGGNVSGETCPHYLLYVAEDMERIGGIAKCAPPFRTVADREALRSMPMVVSDHSPSSLDLKRGDDFTGLWGGISGCQSTRQLLLANGFDPVEVVKVTALNIALRFGLAGKGDIAPGFDADLWLVDLSHRDVLRRMDLLYRNRFSAHEGQEIRGRTVKTLVRGREPGHGRFLRPAGRAR